MSSDPDIEAAPWDPLNDGKWHRMTIEIKNGKGGAGYQRTWLDGHLFWDSSGMPMNRPGIPTSWMWEWVSARKKQKSTIWYDDLTIWRR